MKFLDEVKIYVESGAGGRGCSSFLRTRINPYGGPDGGNGGRGANVFLQAQHGLNTLIDYKFQSVFKGEEGVNGSRSQRTGADAPALILTVPPGTRALDDTKTHVLGDVQAAEDRVLLFPGGRGGLGNACFKSSTNRRPRTTQPPEPGIGAWIVLQMQLVADVGLVGLPNAGKSSFIRSVSRATPTVADYPFTTIYPHLGMVYCYDEEAVFEDIPGLIKGASEGKGLGDQFLRHAQKCSVFLHVVSAEAPNPQEEFDTVRKELLAFDPSFEDKSLCILLSKADLCSEEEIEEKKEALSSYGFPVFTASSHTKKGIDPLIHHLFKVLKKEKS
ncbi:MAG: GTPase ObgE [Alphaproteobacteria bacterium]|nr:GTPase ObgE [Alphaproteobacteria bacterium]